MLASACDRGRGPSARGSVPAAGVEWAGCAVIRSGPVCELGAQRTLTLWVGGGAWSRSGTVIATDKGGDRPAQRGRHRGRYAPHRRDPERRDRDRSPRPGRIGSLDAGDRRGEATRAPRGDRSFNGGRPHRTVRRGSRGIGDPDGPRARRPAWPGERSRRPHGARARKRRAGRARVSRVDRRGRGGRPHFRRGPRQRRAVVGTGQPPSALCRRATPSGGHDCVCGAVPGGTDLDRERRGHAGRRHRRHPHRAGEVPLRRAGGAAPGAHEHGRKCLRRRRAGPHPSRPSRRGNRRAEGAAGARGFLRPGHTRHQPERGVHGSRLAPRDPRGRSRGGSGAGPPRSPRPKLAPTKTAGCWRLSTQRTTRSTPKARVAEMSCSW